MLEQLAEPVACVDAAMRIYSGSASGWEKASEYIYPPPSSGQIGSDQKIVDTGLRHQSVQPLPATFTEQTQKVQYRSYMGIFPQIRCAWLTVDSNLFLWSYELQDRQGPQRTADLFVYEEISQVIVSIALVSPRPGIFVNSVRYLLAVATSVEVTLLGVEFSPTGDVNLVPTHISVATDNTLMIKLLSTPDGRIFMAGADGSLHEFVYETHPRTGLLDMLTGRPVKRARKIVHSKFSLVDYFPASIRTIFTRNDGLVDLVADSARGGLYTLSQSGAVSVYDISEESSTKYVCTVDVAHESRNMVSFSAPAGEREYVSLHVVAGVLMTSVQVIVVTSFGERIYFSSLPRTAATLSSAANPHRSVRGGLDGLRPRTLTCVGYRPSPDRLTSRSSRPCIHVAWCEGGTAVFADLRSVLSDRLIVVYPDSKLGAALSDRRGARPGAGRSSEVVLETTLDSDVIGRRGMFGTHVGTTILDTHSQSAGQQDAAGQTQIRTFAISDAHPAECSIANNAPSTSPFEPPASFLVLSSSAIHLYERIRPVARLTEILESGGGSASDIVSFFETHGAAEACAMCLEIAAICPNLQGAAADVFYTYGGRAQVDKHETHDVSVRGHIPDFGDRREAGPMPYGSVRVGANGSGSSAFDIGRPSLQLTPQSRWSGAHDGVSLYIAKIVFPLWNEYLTSQRDPEGYQSLHAPRKTLVKVRDQLLHLVSFLDNYSADAMLIETRGVETQKLTRRLGDDPQLTRSLPLSTTNMRAEELPRRPGQQERTRGNVRGLDMSRESGDTLRSKSSSIVALTNLVGRIVEALAFLLILEDHQLHRLAVSMRKDSRDLLSKMRFWEFVVGEEGVLLSASLIEAIFGSYADGTVAVSRVGSILRERCPSYFEASDIDLHRGLAMLREAARVMIGISEQCVSADAVRDSQNGWLDQAGRAAPAVSAAQNQAEMAAKILKTVASRVFDIRAVCQDFETVQAIPSMIDVALTVGKVEESRGRQDRADVAYDAVLHAIGPFVNLAEAGEGVNEQNCMLDYNRLKEASMQIALSGESEKFLRRLYEFLLKSKSGEEVLLRSSSPSLEKYLEDSKSLDVLWRYCAHRGRYYEAAAVLLNLSESGDSLNLVDRLNYLSCAMHNAKTAVVKGDNRAGPLLAEVSDFLDVARVQLRVREELLHRHTQGPDVAEALKDLDSSVFGLSTLFNNYARPFKLYEASLEAFRCGEYRDDAYVRSLWSRIIEREAEGAKTPILLGQNIESLGREFYPSAVAFPTGYVIDVLERVVFGNRSLAMWKDASHWVADVMKGIGVPWSETINGYRRMLENPQQTPNSEEPWSWSKQDAQLHLLAATEGTIRKWIGECAGPSLQKGPGPVPTSISRSELEGALRTITLCRTRLLSMSSAGTTTLVESFDALERNVTLLVSA